MSNSRNSNWRSDSRILRVVAAAYFGFILFVIFAANTGRYRPLFAKIYAIPLADKIGHLVLMGGVAFFLNSWMGCRTLNFRGRSLLLGSVLLAILIVGEELTQIVNPFRTFSLADLSFGLIGVFLGGALANRTGKRVRDRVSH